MPSCGFAPNPPPTHTDDLDHLDSHRRTSSGLHVALCLLVFLHDARGLARADLRPLLERHTCQSAVPTAGYRPDRRGQTQRRPRHVAASPRGLARRPRQRTAASTTGTGSAAGRHRGNETSLGNRCSNERSRRATQHRPGPDQPLPTVRSVGAHARLPHRRPMGLRPNKATPAHRTSRGRFADLQQGGEAMPNAGQDMRRHVGARLPGHDGRQSHVPADESLHRSPMLVRGDKLMNSNRAA